MVCYPSIAKLVGAVKTSASLISSGQCQGLGAPNPTGPIARGINDKHVQVLRPNLIGPGHSLSEPVSLRGPDIRPHTEFDPSIALSSEASQAVRIFRGPSCSFASVSNNTAWGGRHASPTFRQVLTSKRATLCRFCGPSCLSVYVSNNSGVISRRVVDPLLRSPDRPLLASEPRRTSFPRPLELVRQRVQPSETPPG